MRKKLQSFSDNLVWQLCDEFNHERTMKARFTLKWRTGKDGSKRHKARLVPQACPDPDPPAGRLDTNSPTTSLLARQILLTIATTEDWPIAMADVQTAYLQVEEQERDLHTCRT